MKTEKVFTIYPENENQLLAKAVFVDGILTKVKLMFKCPRGFYNSIWQDAALEAEKLYL